MVVHPTSLVDGYGAYNLRSKFGQRTCTVFDILDDIVLDNHLVHLLFATCHRYHSMVPDDILVWLRSTYKERCQYKRKMRVYKQQQHDAYIDLPPSNLPPTMMDFIIEQAAKNDNVMIIKWLMDVALVPTTGHAMQMAKEGTKQLLLSRGCVRLPVKKEKVIVTHGSEKGDIGILIGIDDRYGVMKLSRNSDIKLIHMSLLVPLCVSDEM